MRVTLTSTTKFVVLDGVLARIWVGTTESGVPVHAYITAISPQQHDGLEEFDRELQEQAAPMPAVDVIPLKMIL